MCVFTLVHYPLRLWNRNAITEIEHSLLTLETVLESFVPVSEKRKQSPWRGHFGCVFISLNACSVLLKMMILGKNCPLCERKEAFYISGHI